MPERETFLQLGNCLQGIAASVGTSNFLLAFLMASFEPRSVQSCAHEKKCVVHAPESVFCVHTPYRLFRLRVGSRISWSLPDNFAVPSAIGNIELLSFVASITSFALILRGWISDTSIFSNSSMSATRISPCQIHPVIQCISEKMVLAKLSCQIGEALLDLVQKSDNIQPCPKRIYWPGGLSFSLCLLPESRLSSSLLWTIAMLASFRASPILCPLLLSHPEFS